MRLRQLVIAANSLDTADMLNRVLGLGEAYPDPGVEVFGLVNAVFALGDQFLEIVVPTTDSAPARRFIDRGGPDGAGEGGYMAIFATPDLTGARARAAELGLRHVWDIEQEDISATHFHPADVGGAIVSIDEPRPIGSWRWGGPEWESQSVPGHLTGCTLTARDPETLARKWCALLDCHLTLEGGEFSIAIEGGTVRVKQGSSDRLTVFDLAVEAPSAVLSRAADEGLTVHGKAFDIAGVTFELSEI